MARIKALVLRRGYSSTNGPDFQGNFIVSGNSPAYAIATNVLGTNCVWGLYANGPTDENEATAFRGFANPLGTNTFKLQWGSTGAGSTTTVNNVSNPWLDRVCLALRKFQ